MKGWICDTCRGPIVKVEDGWIEWTDYLVEGDRHRTDDNGFQGKGLRLVHHRSENTRCTYVQEVLFKKGLGLCDLPLDSFLGHDGLMSLLSFIAEKKVPVEETLEMIKRLHIPGYEHARFHFKEAISEEVFESNTLAGYHWQSDINAVLNWLKKK